MKPSLCYAWTLFEILEDGHPLKMVRTGFSFASYMGLKDSNVEYRRPPSERKFEIQKDLP